MLCTTPYVKAGEAFPCGKCLPCLVRRKKLWIHRLMLESLCHSDNAFVTLTYADDTLPTDLSLDPATLQKFMKRLRKSIEPKQVRFYAVGEYGDGTQRPHYHILLFGYATCLRGRSVYSRTRSSCCSQCDRIRDAWGLGFVGLGTVTTESVGYVCSYIVKNMRRTDDERLKGRWPEFARMSLRPGIGADAMWEMADVIMKYDLLEDDEDVPLAMRHGAAKKPLGRYLRQKLRGMIGREEKALPNVDEEMLALWSRACAATEKGGEVRRNLFKNLLIDAGAQRVLNMETRLKIRKGRRVL